MVLATLAGVAVACAGTVAGIDALLTARVASGADTAQRLSVILTYVGVDRSYVLARSFGLAAIACAWASVALGLELGRRRAVGAAPAPVLAAVHRQVGLATLVLVVGHVVAPYSSPVTPYGGWKTALVPFAQPFSWGAGPTTWESFGIIAFYLLVILGPTFYLLRGARRRIWASVHTLSAAAYALAVAHTFLLGSDFFVRGPARVGLVAAQVPLAALIARRLRASSAGRITGPAGLGSVAAAAGAVALAVLAGLGASGAVLGGFRL